MKSLILGFGQDAILLAQCLERQNLDYRIIARRSLSSVARGKTSNLIKNNIIFHNDLSTQAYISLYKDFEFTHVFNFAANSFVQDSKTNFEFFHLNNSKILWDIFSLETFIPKLWVFHPVSSEILASDNWQESDQIRPLPRNAYGVAKAQDLHACNVMNYHSTFNVSACVMFNHESRYRSPQFFSKKVVEAFQKVQNGETINLSIYNCKSTRDWGSAKEFMEIICKAAYGGLVGESMLATCVPMTVEEFIDNCFKVCDWDYEKLEIGGLINWNSKNLTIREKKRDAKDTERKVIGSQTLVYRSFGTVPSITRINLITGLLDGSL